MTSLDLSRATVFGRDADAYEHWRPGYPSEAVEWMVPEGASHVADVGAGTGKLTERLLERGLTVDAVEPDHRMLDVLRRLRPTARTHQAAADVLPFPDASLDAVLVADAWHWFPFDRAVPEVRRVLAPGGWLGLVWNLVAPLDSWQRELAALDGSRHAGSRDESGAGSAAEPLLVVPGLPADEVQVARFPWTWELTPAHVRAWTATNSAFVVMKAEEREVRLDAYEAVAARACAQQGWETFPVRFEAVCARWSPS